MTAGRPASTGADALGLDRRDLGRDAGTVLPLGCVASQPGKLCLMALDAEHGGSGETLAALADEFGQLAVSLADGADEPFTQKRLVEFAVRGIPGAEYASMTVIQSHRPPRTTAGSSDLPYRWDWLQYQYGEGPCLEAIASNRVQIVADLTTETRWPQFARAIVDRGPARSMLCFRLFATEEHRTGLNLYATRPSAFDDRSIATASMFAAYASVAVLAAARHAKVKNLILALETNREIGVAMGILMANGRLTGPQAFEQLRTASQNLNRKLRDIAADVATTGALPPVVPPAVTR